MMANPPSSEQGASLLEVLVSAALLLIAAGGIWGATAFMDNGISTWSNVSQQWQQQDLAALSGQNVQNTYATITVNQTAETVSVVAATNSTPMGTAYVLP